MKNIEIGKHRVEIYDSIEDLPVTRYHKYQKLLLLESGIGSDMGDFDRKTEKIRQFIATGDAKNAEKELSNLRMMVYFIQMNISPKLMSFAVLVRSIDGKIFDDISDDGLRRVIDALKNTPIRIIAEALLSVKKKIDGELRIYFPILFEGADSKEFYDLLRKRTMAVLSNLSEGKLEDDNIRKMTAEILMFDKPDVFTGKESAEVKFDKNFETICMMLSENTSAEPKKMTVMEYYNAYEYAQEKAKQIKNARHK